MITVCSGGVGLSCSDANFIRGPAGEEFLVESAISTRNGDIQSGVVDSQGLVTLFKI